MFLELLGNELGIDVSYVNHLGFMQCFVLNSMKLEKPVFVLRDFNTAIGCEEALIEPGFGSYARDRIIRLACTFKNASFFGADGKNASPGGIVDVLSGGISGFFKELELPLYDTIQTTLLVYRDRVSFESFRAENEDVLIFASGTLSKSLEVSLKIKCYFSPRMASGMDEGLRKLLTDAPGGWYSYSASLEKGEKKRFLNLDSDRLRLEIKELEIK